MYGDEDTPHRRKARKKAFSKIKKWGRKRGGGEEPGTLPYEATLSDGDKFAVKVNVFTLSCYTYLSLTCTPPLCPSGVWTARATSLCSCLHSLCFPVCVPTPSAVLAFPVQYKQASHKQNKHEFEKVRLKQDLTGIHLVSSGDVSCCVGSECVSTSGGYLGHGVLHMWSAPCNCGTR